MEAGKLVHMANQIGTFFEAGGDAAAAADSVADHIRRFWDPRMRRAIFEWLDQHGGEGLQPLVLQALQKHREKLQPA
ncbi:MAG: formate dehydrogenase subunit delta [Burkholderiales bacterium]|nr:formate dehydrogenase subunit delta [Burkholderiales bacterium]